MSMLRRRLQPPRTLSQHPQWARPTIRRRSRPFGVLVTLPLLWAALTLPIPTPAAIGAAADVSFIAFGDMGTLSAGQLALRDQMVAHSADFDFGLTVGDNAYPSGAYSDFTSKVFGVYGGLFQGQNQALPAPTSSNPKPLYATPGNHEYEADKTAAGFHSSFILPANGPAGIPAEKFYTYDVGAVHFVSFDSHFLVGWDMTTTTQAQRDAVRAWLISDLDAHVNQVTVLYDHQPAYTAGPHHGEQEETLMRSTWFPVFASHGVDLFLSGHDHSYQRNTPQSGLTSYVLGTGGGALTAATPQSYTAASLSDYAYLQVGVTGCSISTTAIRSSGATFDPWTFTAPTCSSGPGSGQLFADGFETGDFSAWTTVQVGPSSNASVQAATVKSGSFAAALSATSTAGSYAYARKQLPSAKLDVIASGDFRVTGEGAAGGNVPLIRLYNSGGTRILSLYRQNASGSKLYVQHSGLYNTTTGVLPLDTWGRLSVKVHVNGTSSSVEIRLNGALIHQSSSADLGGTGVLRLQIGNDTTTQAFSLFADNISVDDGNGPTPTPSPTASPTQAPTPTPTPTPTPSSSVGPTPTPSPVTILSDGFESGALTPWTVRTGTGGVANVQQTTVKSGVFAAHLSATTAGGSYSYIRQSLGPARTLLTSSADFRLAAEGASGGNVPLIRLFDATGNRIINVYRQNANANRLYVAFGGVTYQTSGLLPLNTWANVSVRAVVGGASGTVEVKVNGAVVYTNAAANLGAAGLTSIQLGNDTKKQAFDLFVDNVLIKTP